MSPGVSKSTLRRRRRKQHTSAIKALLLLYGLNDKYVINPRSYYSILFSWPSRYTFVQHCMPLNIWVLVVKHFACPGNLVAKYYHWSGPPFDDYPIFYKTWEEVPLTLRSKKTSSGQ